MLGLDIFMDKPLFNSIFRTVICSPALLYAWPLYYGYPKASSLEFMISAIFAIEINITEYKFLLAKN
jgi:hypothetical protein